MVLLKHTHREVEPFKDCHDVAIRLSDGKKVLIMVQGGPRKINRTKLDPNTPPDAPVEEPLDYVIDWVDQIY